MYFIKDECKVVQKYPFIFCPQENSSKYSGTPYKILKKNVSIVYYIYIEHLLSKSSRINLKFIKHILLFSSVHYLWYRY